MVSNDGSGQEPGAIVAGLAVLAIEKGATTSVGVGLEVELDSGEILAIVQKKDALYNLGDRIRVLREARAQFWFASNPWMQEVLTV